MSMYIPSSTDADWSEESTLTPKSGTTSSLTSPTTRNDILGILQREQDHATFLLSLSPLLSSLFVSYANRTASLGSNSPTPTPESEEWKTLQRCITALQEENGRLKSENRETVLKLKAAEVSQEGFRSRVSSLEQVNAAQRSEVDSLRKELVESKDVYERVMKDLNVEKAAYQSRISSVEAELLELKQSRVKASNGDNPPVRPIRHTPSQVWRNSLTPSDGIATCPLRTLSAEVGEEALESPFTSIYTVEEDVPPPPPGPNEKARPKNLSLGSPSPSNTRSQTNRKKSFRGGWLKALNDSF